MNSGEREMYLSRGVRHLKYSSRIQQSGEDQKLYDFLSIFHPKMSHAEKVEMVLEAHPDSRINRSGRVESQT